MTIINLQDKLKERKQATGEQEFMLCPCKKPDEPTTGFVPLVVHDSQGCFIACLLCPNCENEITIVNGRPQHEG